VVLVGRSARTNAAGIDELSSILKHQFSRQYTVREVLAPVQGSPDGILDGILVGALDGILAVSIPFTMTETAINNMTKIMLIDLYRTVLFTRCPGSWLDRHQALLKGFNKTCQTCSIILKIICSAVLVKPLSVA